MDLSIEAIEADLARAESTLGRPESAIHMQRAQVRATLRAAQQSMVLNAGPELDELDISIQRGPFGETLEVPAQASYRDRVTAAAHLLGLQPDDLAARLNPTAGTAAPAKLVEDDQRSQYADEDFKEDFFAEARKEHKKSGK